MSGGKAVSHYFPDGDSSIGKLGVEKTMGSVTKRGKGLPNLSFRRFRLVRAVEGGGVALEGDVAVWEVFPAPTKHAAWGAGREGGGWRWRRVLAGLGVRGGSARSGV